MKPSLLRELAVGRFRTGGPDVAEGLERSALDGIKAGDWPKVRRALKLRLSMKLKPDAAKHFQIDRILRLVDEAEEKGIAGTGEFDRCIREADVRVCLSCRLSEEHS